MLFILVSIVAMSCLAVVIDWDLLLESEKPIEDCLVVSPEISLVLDAACLRQFLGLERCHIATESAEGIFVVNRSGVRVVSRNHLLPPYSLANLSLVQRDFARYRKVIVIEDDDLSLRLRTLWDFILAAHNARTSALRSDLSGVNRDGYVITPF